MRDILSENQKLGVLDPFKNAENLIYTLDVLNTSHSPLARVPLTALHAAAVVARHGTLGAAATELGITPGAVSQRVSRCEDALGQPLFLRSVSGMQPAEGSEPILRQLIEGFDRLSEAVSLAHRDREAVLTLSIAPIFAARWLIWRLPAFSKAHPGIRVRIDSDIAMADPNRGDVDLGLRVGRGPYPGLRAERLFAHRFIPVCSPEWARQIRTERDLARVPIIRDTGQLYTWGDWLAPVGMSPELLGPGPEFSDAAMCLDAAMGGAGVFLAFETVAWDALNRGQIVAPIPRWEQAGLSYWLVSATNRAQSRASRQFRDWLKETLAQSGLGS